MRSFIWIGAVAGIQHIKHPTCPGAACIFPVDGAEFLTGAKFDIRVEMHGEGRAPRDDFQVTIRPVGGQDAQLEDFFEMGPAPPLEHWNFTYAKDNRIMHQGLGGDTKAFTPVAVASRVWRGAQFKRGGHFNVTITYDGGATHHVEWIVRPAACRRKANNVILFITDGTSINMLTAARVMAKKHRNGKFPDKLEMDSADHVGHVLTHALDTMMTDSSNSASAYHTGHKTAIHAIGVYPDSSPDPFDDPRLETLAELARRRDAKRGGRMAVGVVTTAEVQDATPAAVFSHLRRRKHKKHILNQMVDGPDAVWADVYLGGGGKYFLNRTEDEPRLQKDYYGLFRDRGYHVVHNKTALTAYTGTDPLLGIFHTGDMDVLVDRHIYPQNLVGNGASPLGDGTDALDQPSLVDMTRKTLDVLKARGGRAGFFAMIEAASPDKKMHDLDYHRSLVDILEFDRAIKAAVEWVRENDRQTTIVITADHAQGYDVFGSVDTALFNEAVDPDTKREAVGIYEHAGWPDYADNDGDGYPDRLDVRTTFAGLSNNHPDMYESFQMNLTRPRTPAIRETPGKAYPSFTANPNFDRGGLLLTGPLPKYEDQATHSMTDVAIFASGPASELFAGVMDSTDVFFKIADILALGAADASSCRCHAKKRSHYD